MENSKTSQGSFISHDIWFNGSGDCMGENGKPSYYICQHMDKNHYFEERKGFGPFCKYNEKPLEEVECGLVCPEFGYCRTCSGFSAIRCQECDLIRE